jgi:hypothetical protein
MAGVDMRNPEELEKFTDERNKDTKNIIVRYGATDAEIASFKAKHGGSA